MNETVHIEKRNDASDVIRIMTYNVHSCVGTDGTISPERVARVISRHTPDIVALQELDNGRRRTGRVDQPRLLAQELAMQYHFYPSIIYDSEHYGNAVLSRYPMELVRAGRLTDPLRITRVEPRGVIWAAIFIAGNRINVFNTHLGVFPWERVRQTRTLLGPEWLGHPDCRWPVIVCGDFNASPHSRLCRTIKKEYSDVQEALVDYSPRATWSSRYPIGRIDHIFVSPEIEVTHVEVSSTPLDKIASDHLPLVVDITLLHKAASVLATV